MECKKVQKLDSLKPGIIKNIECLQGSILVTLTSCTYSWSPDLPVWIELLHYIKITMDFLLWSNPIQLNWRPVILSPYGQHYLVLLRNGQFPISFSLFSSLQYSWQKKNVKYKFCRLLDSNHGHLVSEVSTLPTEPQPPPILWSIFARHCSPTNQPSVVTS